MTTFASSRSIYSEGIFYFDAIKYKCQYKLDKKKQVIF